MFPDAPDLIGLDDIDNHQLMFKSIYNILLKRTEVIVDGDLYVLYN